MTNEKECPLCGAKGSNLWKKKDRFYLMRCTTCGLVFIPKHFYEGIDIKKQYVNDDGCPTTYYSATKYWDKRYFNRNLAMVEKYINSGVVLDIGCTVGTFMSVAKMRGWETMGIEPNPESAKFAKQFGLVYNTFFDNQFSISKRINLIHMSDVIEHRPDPFDIVKTAYRILPEKGMLIISTCDIDSFLGQKYHIKFGEHLVYFNKKSLEYVLKKTGFKIKLCRRITRPRDFSNIHRSTVKIGALESLFLKFKKIHKLASYVSEILFFDGILIIGEK